LEYKKEVFETDIQSLTSQTGVEIIEASAKEATKINDVMEKMTRSLIEKHDKKDKSNNLHMGYKIPLNNTLNDRNNNKGCC
jgi:hypothetical protein